MDGVQFTPYCAGHVLGACMFDIEIAGVRVRTLPIHVPCTTLLCVPTEGREVCLHGLSGGICGVWCFAWDMNHLWKYCCSDCFFHLHYRVAPLSPPRFFRYPPCLFLSSPLPPFLLHVNAQLVYTGDFSREEDRHLMAAELPPAHPDILITESTFGVRQHESRHMRELRFTKTVHEVMDRGGRCLIPVFALGRAQELLLILGK